jgi:hypothetical protein
MYDRSIPTSRARTVNAFAISNTDTKKLMGGGEVASWSQTQSAKEAEVACFKIWGSPIPRQLPLSPIPRLFSGLEHALGVAI